MKYFLTILFGCMIVLNGNCQKDTINSQIQTIRANFKEINSFTKWSKVDSVSFYGESAEGANAKFYYKNDELKKVVAIYYGETGKYIVEFYIKGKELAFVLEREYTYNRPIYHTLISKKENSDTEIFDSKKSKITEIRSYFYKQKLIKQLRENKQANIEEEEKRIILAFENLKNKIKNH